MVHLTADFLGFGEVAEWFKAAVLKTASREHRNTSQNSQSRRNPSRNNRVPRLFAKNIRAQESAQMRFFIDCEFDGHGGELLSMALVREDGRGIYLCIADEPDLLDSWVRQNVWPLVHRRLPVGRTVAYVADWGDFIRSFLTPYGDPVIVADSPVDIWRFCEVISTDADGCWRSTDYPRMTFEVHNVDCYPTTLPDAIQHNAWWDAMALRHKLASVDERPKGRDGNRLGAKPASAIGEAETPNLSSLSPSIEDEWLSGGERV